MAGEAFIRRAAVRAGVTEEVAAAVWSAYWRAVRAAAARLHEEGRDPRKPAGRVALDRLGSIVVMPGKRVRKPKIKEYDKSEEDKAAVQQHRDDGEEV